MYFLQKTYLKHKDREVLKTKYWKKTQCKKKVAIAILIFGSKEALL